MRKIFTVFMRKNQFFSKFSIGRSIIIQHKFIKKSLYCFSSSNDQKSCQNKNCGCSGPIQESDKEKEFKEAIEYVNDYLFHGTVEISMIYYIDPRLLIRFVTKHNLNPFNCFYSLKLWRFQLWSIPWIVNRNLEIL